jgi:hypothetical protein
MAGKQNFNGFNSDKIIRPIRHRDTVSIPRHKSFQRLESKVGFYHQTIERFLDVDK